MILLIFLISLDPRYHTFEEVGYELDSIATHFSQIAQLDTIGYSTVDEMPIFALKLSDNVNIDEDEPALLYVACHHAEEVLGIELCMYMIEDLIDNYNIDSTITYWINNREIWFVPLLNPEGHTVVTQSIDTTWRKNKRDNNNNNIFDLDYDGVDPNRNYDFYWTEGGSSDPSSEYYRGPAPFSEDETKALRDLCLAHNFVFCNTYHSARTGLGEVIYFPWRAADYYSPDYSIIRVVADSMSKLIVNEAGNGHYFALPGSGVDGRARNWIYGICGTFCFCVEICTTTIIPGSMVDDVCQRNSVGSYYLLNRIQGTGITGCVYDSITGEPLRCEVIIEEHYDPKLPARMTDSTYGRFIRILNSGSYNIAFHKSGYLSKYYSNLEVLTGQMMELDVFLEKKEIEQKYEKPETGILIFPNPAREAMIIYLEEPDIFSSLKICDISGRVLKDFRQPVTNELIWLCRDEISRDIPNGVYYIIGETTTQRYVKKIVVNN